MSVDIPAFHAGAMMVSARKKLFKLGWKQSENGRMDCIEKVFGEYIIQTIWAGNQLLLNAHKVDSEKDQYGNRVGYVPCDNPIFEQVKNEIQPIFDRIVKRNKKRWSKEIEEYEKREREMGDFNFVFPRNKRYGV